MKEKMFRLLPLLAALAFCVVVAAIAGETRFFIPDGQRTTSSDYVVPVINQPTAGYLVPATATFSIPQHAAVKVPTLPTGTKQFRVYVNPGAGANIGPSSVASGTTYPEIASATLSDPVTVGTLTPDVYMIGRTAAATGTLICQ